MLEKKTYNLLNNLPDDEKVINEIFEYGDLTYISDAMEEVARENVCIYDNDLWEIAPNIQEYIEETILNRPANTQSIHSDLVKIFMAGHYNYNITLLYENLEEIIYNYAINYIEEKQIKIDLEELELELASIDHNNTFDDIVDVVNEMIELEQAV